MAASITPAENPSITSNNLSEIRLVNNTGMAPAPVAKPATKLAMEPSQMISVLIVLSQLIGAHIKKGGRYIVLLPALFNVSELLSVGAFSRCSSSKVARRPSFQKFLEPSFVLHFFMQNSQ